MITVFLLQIKFKKCHKAKEITNATITPTSKYLVWVFSNSVMTEVTRSSFWLTSEG